MEGGVSLAVCNIPLRGLLHFVQHVIANSRRAFARWRIALRVRARGDYYYYYYYYMTREGGGGGAPGAGRASRKGTIGAAGAATSFVAKW